ncbi:hypothetical protein ACJJTC_016746 [Scirpophaga incertulas]
MLRVALVCCVLGVALATPAVVRTKEEIQAFRHFLESTKNDGATRNTRIPISPKANPEENSGKFQGDIVLDDFMIERLLQQYASGRNAYTHPEAKWPDNTVVWDFAEDQFGPLQQQAILDGIKDIEDNTCIKFRRREPEDTVFVNVTGMDGGCYAHVGYWQPRGVHTYNLARNVPGVGCFRHATIVHEWMHILGFLHMQSTHDRDNYVQIVSENSDLEYEGVMGQREYITEKDWIRINRQYNCPGAWN